MKGFDLLRRFWLYVQSALSLFPFILLGVFIYCFINYRQREESQELRFQQIDSKLKNLSGFVSKGQPDVFFEQALLRQENQAFHRDKGDSMPTAPQSTAVLLQKSCKNAIVKVITNQLTFNWQEPYKNLDQVESRGSGFFIDDEGHFLTNFHVVAQRLRVQIQMSVFGQSKMDCDVIGVCPDRDLALLKIDDAAKNKIIAKLGKIEFLPLGNSDVISRGADVITLGFPLGKDVIKSTTGIVSGWEDLQLGERGAVLSCLEITAPINSGSSGGPALDGDGAVIGVNFAVVDKAQNIGYVLPINELKSAIRQLRDQKLLFKPHLGIVTQVTTSTFEQCFGNPPNGGVYVRRVLGSSLADKAGIKVGDMIYEMGGFLLDHHGDALVPWREDRVLYSNILQRLELGDNIEIVLYRQGERKVINFDLDSSEQVIKIRARYPSFEEIDYEVFGGLVVMELTLNHILELYSTNPGLLKYSLPQNIDKSVLVVTFVQGTSEAHRNSGGICKGSVLEKVGGSSVNTLSQLRHELLNNLDNAFITVSGDDQSLTIFDTQKMLEDEPRLAHLFKYNSDHSVVLAKSMGF